MTNTFTSEQICQELNISDKTLRNWKSELKSRGYRIGVQIGRRIFYSDDDMNLLRTVANSGMPDGKAETSGVTDDGDYRKFEATGSEDNISALVKAGDARFAALGRQCGQRWTQVFMASALQSLEMHVVEAQNCFEQMLDAPQLPPMPRLMLTTGEVDIAGTGVGQW